MRLFVAALLLFSIVVPLAVYADATSVSVSVFIPECADGIDNDGDALIDYPNDLGCSSLLDDDETDASYDCSDSIDNDGDGLIDYPSDPGCDNATDTSEVNLPSGGGGGGGGGSSSSNGDSVITVSGSAYPNSTVLFYMDGKEILKTVSGPDARFTFTKSKLEARSYVFSVVAIDPKNRRSPTFPIPITLPEGGSTTISGVFLAPTLATDYEQVRRGDTITLFGNSVPDASVNVEVNSDPLFFSSLADTNGAYLLQFNSALLSLGKHTAKSKAQSGNLVSPYGHAISFKVGNTTELRSGSTKGDINNDARINLYDFSVAAYWYKRVLVGDIVTYEAEQLSGDGVIDLIDFSIIAYYWTN